MNQSKTNRALTLLLIFIVLLTLGVFAFLLAVPARGEAFTEFSIIGTRGKAADYPKNLKKGEVETVILTIVNREKKPMAYRVDIDLDGTAENVPDEILLEDGEIFESSVNFSFDGPGEARRMDFFLYRQGDDEAYRSLSIFVDVTD